MHNIYTRVHHRKDTDESWSSSNPVLLDGEIILVSTNDKIRIKVGDGISNYKDLPFITADGDLSIDTSPEDVGKILGVGVDGKITLMQAHECEISIPTTPADAGKVLGVDENGNITLIEATVVSGGKMTWGDLKDMTSK